MNNESTYNIFNALTYELIMWLCKFYPLKRKPWIRAILKNCLPDWAAFRAELAAKDIEQQAAEIVKKWAEEEPPNYEVIEQKPDGSKAQDLLGGAMEIRSKWRRD